MNKFTEHFDKVLKTQPQNLHAKIVELLKATARQDEQIAKLVSNNNKLIAQVQKLTKEVSELKIGIK